MIYKHKFLKNDLCEGKCQKQVTKDQPLIIMVENDQFLYYTIQKSLTFLQIPHKIIGLNQESVEGRRKTMEHELPTLIFSNQVLETVQLVQFLCDAYLTDSNILDFESRKALIKQLVKIWKQIFLMERFYPYQFDKLINFGVRDKKSYQNLIFQELTMLELYFKKNLLQRVYISYSEINIALELLLFVDIIKTIKKKFPQTFIDYCLRSTFLFLIQQSIKVEQKIEKTIINKQQIINENINNYSVLLLQQVPNNKRQWDNTKVNWQKFTIVFGIVGALYAIFVKN